MGETYTDWWPEGRIVSIAVMGERVFVATENRVYELIEGAFRPLVFVRGAEKE